MYTIMPSASQWASDVMTVQGGCCQFTEECLKHELFLSVNRSITFLSRAFSRSHNLLLMPPRSSSCCFPLLLTLFQALLGPRQRVGCPGVTFAHLFDALNLPK